jgi:hypothetical protein
MRELTFEASRPAPDCPDYRRRIYRAAYGLLRQLGPAAARGFLVLRIEVAIEEDDPDALYDWVSVWLAVTKLEATGDGNG